MGSVRKDPYELLRICNENEGKVITDREALKLFGYHERTDIWRTQLKNFLISEGIPPNRWKIKEYAFILCEELPEFLFSNSPSTYRTVRIKGKWYFLYPREKVPFWRLKEFGGTID